MSEPDPPPGAGLAVAAPLGGLVGLVQRDPGEVNAGQLRTVVGGLRFWLPIVVPLAGFSFTTISCTSWWWSTEEHPVLLGRKGWRFLMVFVVALSLMAGFFGSMHRDVVAVLLTVMVTTICIAGQGLLPPACRRGCSEDHRNEQRRRQQLDQPADQAAPSSQPPAADGEAGRLRATS
ncbi:hypothetical protein [Streptomyces sp. NPDC059881]|uniref:hypothetical protein n=1 Tax=Streptomyces sp. NPDC059881 TaxID=3346986 RepID=UPI003658F537